MASVIIPPETNWRWFYSGDGKHPGFGPEFTSLDFKAAVWGTAPGSEEPGGEFGYSKTGSHVIRPPSQGVLATAYFRCEFGTETPHSRLELRCRRDDGIIGYLDGTEMARDNLPEVGNTGGLPALAATAATAELDCVLAFDEEFVLSPGPHVLGISVHNSGIESNDLLLGAVTLVEVAK